jgi:hypothetical protein
MKQICHDRMTAMATCQAHIRSCEEVTRALFFFLSSLFMLPSILHCLQAVYDIT